ncbi:class I SAM-dependent methyltransferase [Pedobacter sandarakinus]|uniref:class I SAM-dependent methyltransferase n=1 Tax=Pedobacter sandarakinus TaxID=353156 RepID=UPI002246AB0F|nr:class I SAM-dependent methyltransferase [Pedobacter sandarakinus]MCX2575147.1 class I SAM-dependent methyltransferase [Pedobacter sandarakinus]
MNENILNEEIQKFIDNNLEKDVTEIALAKNKFAEVSAQEIAGQILSKRKAEKKLPTWFNAKGIYYPPSLSIEQTSSELTAEYKAKLLIGTSVVDITGGFGVDAYFFAQRMKIVKHCEINPALSKIAEHNAAVLGANNIAFESQDGLALIADLPNQVDNIYVDPARRAKKGKVFLLKDCSPDIVEHLPFLLQKATRVLIKTAPLLDITAGLAELSNVSEIHIVSVKNECKELLWVIDRNSEQDPTVFAVAINETEKVFKFKLSQRDISADFADDLSHFNYLYEPDTALLKSGAFNLIGRVYNLKKLQQQTQLFVSDIINISFPGRIFKIVKFITASELKKNANLNANVIVRNYPAKAEDLVKKYRIKPSNTLFLIFTRWHNDNIIIQAEIKQHY